VTAGCPELHAVEIKATAATATSLTMVGP